MIRHRLRLLAALLAGLGAVAGARAAEYPITPQAVAPDSWAVIADTGYFTPQNGGFLVNTAFIATAEGVVVIGSGPSRAFGQQYRRVIERTAGKPVRELVITHKHPDHFLGNQAFSDVPIRADEKTTAMLRNEAEGLAENLYRLVGDRMQGTEPLLPNAPLTPGVREIGGHTLEFIAVPGHTQSDIAVFDHTSGVLYAIDQVFNGRTPTLPNASLPDWLAALDRLEALPFKTLVPGHGAVTHDAAPIRATRRYLQWLDATLKDAARHGLTPTEAMALPIPAEFAGWAEARAEWRRSVGFLYARYELAELPALAAPDQPTD
ncbi:quinoprotein relay system zinc metallohydrolase 1 [Pseudogulbenkiania ferrooxidans]|uniref:Beta-lactamase domain protein n=1 Tax=Pseudogulbenkiania ferrooxidans 2002 TaxID=279714 RepID=B9YZH8_9NEIS|nr:quinoprotein relay system zinc metallohydrolase 1 [Pseudogulbenkiania ferrooxidans]EEG10531.1 beta-lactamase domain protein [Pseudogulbenkiania ferrooxidans 2002]